MKKKRVNLGCSEVLTYRTNYKSTYTVSLLIFRYSHKFPISWESKIFIGNIKIKVKT